MSSLGRISLSHRDFKQIKKRSPDLDQGYYSLQINQILMLPIPQLDSLAHSPNLANHFNRI